ncbi:hypothetical protein [Actinomadura citrea]|uniref:hypothetical protein n=1 Tax=Actinomadura citrea TaxID=46158 RepID=UPI002E2A9754|nr:hypothetical protein [Actinomadura citrea]
MLIPIAVFYIPMRYAGSVDLAMPDTGPSGIYARLAYRGYGPVRFDEDIEVRSPTVEEQKRLSYGWAAGPVNGWRDPGRPDP